MLVTVQAQNALWALPLNHQGRPDISYKAAEYNAFI